MDESWFRFVLGVLATWRVAHLLAHEDGPWDAVLRLRVLLGNGVWGRLVDCFACLSLWVAAPIALAVGRNPGEWVLAWLALSGAACVLQRAVREPVMISPLAGLERLDTEGDDDGLLRTTARSAGDNNGGNERLGATASCAGPDSSALPAVR
jgi:hypothetical protein